MFFNRARMMLILRMVGGQIAIIVDTNYQGVSIIMLKSVKIFLPSDLIYGDIRTLVLYDTSARCPNASPSCVLISPLPMNGTGLHRI